MFVLPWNPPSIDVSLCVLENMSLPCSLTLDLMERFAWEIINQMSAEDDYRRIHVALAECYLRGFWYQAILRAVLVYELLLLIVLVRASKTFPHMLYNAALSCLSSPDHTSPHTSPTPYGNLSWTHQSVSPPGWSPCSLHSLWIYLGSLAELMAPMDQYQASLSHSSQTMPGPCTSRHSINTFLSLQNVLLCHFHENKKPKQNKTSKLTNKSLPIYCSESWWS